MSPSTEVPQRQYSSRLNVLLAQKFPYFKGTVQRQYDAFGDDWLEFFERSMEVMFGDNLARFDRAIEGYGRFVLEGMKLQTEFTKTRAYPAKTFEEARLEVYDNKEYMMSLYLPGILLSHFLWYHHYKQYVFYLREFLPRIRAHGGDLFYDVGVGTGFYTMELLRANPNLRGKGFDLSPFSMEYTLNTIGAYGLGDRYDGVLQNIIKDKVEPPASFILNIEVLEHLEDPQTFLIALNGMLEKGGFGLISAALTAPNADHIYLYNEPEEVIDQLETAGFSIVKFVEDPGYEPRKPTDSVPRNAAFLVTK